jgi:hypothetical protein
MTRTPITTTKDLAALDGSEVLAGYRSGLAGDEEPGGNHSMSYWHGWRNGVSDRAGATDEAQRQLAHEVVETGYLRALRTA